MVPITNGIAAVGSPRAPGSPARSGRRARSRARPTHQRNTHRIARALGERVPARVEHGRARDEEQRRDGHPDRVGVSPGHAKRLLWRVSRDGLLAPSHRRSARRGRGGPSAARARACSTRARARCWTTWPPSRCRRWARPIPSRAPARRARCSTGSSWSASPRPRRADACCSSTRSISPGGAGWLMRCDRVDFDPGGIAPPHRHRGGGIRCLLRGRLEVTVAEGAPRTVEPGEAWFESGREPVLAVAAPERRDQLHPLLDPARRDPRAELHPLRGSRRRGARPAAPLHGLRGRADRALSAMRILILSASYGSGHAEAARSLAAAFEARGAEAVVVDHFRELVHPVFAHVSRAVYYWLLRRAPGVWALAYGLGDRMGPESAAGLRDDPGRHRAPGPPARHDAAGRGHHGARDARGRHGRARGERPPPAAPHHRGHRLRGPQPVDAEPGGPLLRGRGGGAERVRGARHPARAGDRHRGAGARGIRARGGRGRGAPGARPLARPAHHRGDGGHPGLARPAARRRPRAAHDGAADAGGGGGRPRRAPARRPRAPGRDEPGARGGLRGRRAHAPGRGGPARHQGGRDDARRGDRGGDAAAALRLAAGPGARQRALRLARGHRAGGALARRRSAGSWIGRWAIPTRSSGCRARCGACAAPTRRQHIVDLVVEQIAQRGRP